jgi:hypothetical protein
MKDFRCTFQWFVAQIEYSRPLKVLPSKSGFTCRFILPKSSFGRDTPKSSTHTLAKRFKRHARHDASCMFHSSPPCYSAAASRTTSVRQIGHVRARSSHSETHARHPICWTISIHWANMSSKSYAYMKVEHQMSTACSSVKMIALQHAEQDDGRMTMCRYVCRVIKMMIGCQCVAMSV